MLEFFNAPPDEYLCIFTANASAALRLVGESYRFAPGGTYALTFDNHNSVNGIREFARRKGAAIAYVPVVAPELRIDRAAMSRTLAAGDPSARNLLAFPAQSNFSGVQHPLDLVDEAHAAGWDVLVDAAAFAPTNRFDVARVRPDFATFSFYKMMGFPTGVGCLLCPARPARGARAAVVRRRHDHHRLGAGRRSLPPSTTRRRSRTAPSTTSTCPAVATGLRHLERVGVDAIHERVVA